jgi:hypothetical protein
MLKRNAKGFRELVRLAMKYKVRWDAATNTSVCLVCGHKAEGGFMYEHIATHVENEEITAQNVVGGNE